MTAVCASTVAYSAGAAEFMLIDSQVRQARPAPLMRPTGEDCYRPGCTRVAPAMTYVEVLAALYGFACLSDPWSLPLAQLRAELCRVTAAFGMSAIRETAAWITRHGEGVRRNGHVAYGVHVQVLRMSAMRVQAGRLCCAYGDDFWHMAGDTGTGDRPVSVSVSALVSGVAA